MVFGRFSGFGVFNNQSPCAIMNLSSKGNKQFEKGTKKRQKLGLGILKELVPGICFRKRGLDKWET